MDKTLFEQFIKNHSWRNAKTFQDFAPHEYVINFPCWKMKQEGKCKNNCEPCKKQRQEFEDVVMFIRENGEKVRFGKSVFTVLKSGDRHYWTMGDPLETTWVLNRAITNDPRTKIKTVWLEKEQTEPDKEKGVQNNAIQGELF